MPSLSILLVEDNLLAQQVIQQLLLSKNCSVDTAETGAEALEKFKQNRYQLIFMDIELPDLNGYEVTRTIRNYEAEHHHTPIWIIGITASVEKEEFYRGIHAGMNNIYAKPISNQLLTDILAMVSHPAKSESISRDSLYDKNDQQPVIDLNLGAKILGGTVEAAEKMIVALVSVLPDDLKKIQAAFSKKDYSTLKDLAHYLKGGASFCGTPRLKEAASHLDKIIKFRSNSQDIEMAYQQLCQEIDAVMKEYHHSIKK